MATITSDALNILLEAPLPIETDSYSVMSHKDVIDLTYEAIDKAGMAVKGASYTTSKGGKQGMGHYEIANSLDPEMGIKIAWNNSYDKSMTLKWAIGAHVFVCGNGCVAGDMGAFKRKHTGSVHKDYQNAITMYVTQAGELFEKLVTDRERLKEIEITNRTKAELLGRMFLEEEVIQATQLGIIKKELEAPTHDYNAKGTAWELYNYTTFALKEAHPTLYLPQHIKTHEFFMKEFA